ncbi:MAG: hypothetical protein IPO28_12880 [Holophagaceae bacterium]|nr:hypothetical protein [Holophagaceae bacterium]
MPTTWPWSPGDRLTFYTITGLPPSAEGDCAGSLLTHPGTFDWFEGMRAADLVFRGGNPQVSANRYYAELAHTRMGKPSQVLRLDLERLLSTESGSPVP